jgi:hypothetical protein
MATKPPRRPKHCYYCKRMLTAPTDRARTAATRDHIVPKHMGGRRTVPCCRQCNSLKGPLSIDAWRRIMAKYPDWWRRFRDRGELIDAERLDSWQRHREKQARGRWPAGVRVPPPQLCRGLPRTVNLAGIG